VRNETHSTTREVLPGSDNFAAGGPAVEAKNNKLKQKPGTPVPERNNERRQHQ
jgi:hypothetical protein